MIRANGFEKDGHPVPAVEPVYFDDPPTDASFETHAQLLLGLLALLDVPPRSLHARVAALRRAGGCDTGTLRESAVKARCSLASLFRQERAVKQILRVMMGRK